jgi:hypothetical protein
MSSRAHRQPHRAYWVPVVVKTIHMAGDTQNEFHWLPISKALKINAAAADLPRTNLLHE